MVPVTDNMLAKKEVYALSYNFLYYCVVVFSLFSLLSFFITETHFYGKNFLTLRRIYGGQKINGQRLLF